MTPAKRLGMLAGVNGKRGNNGRTLESMTAETTTPVRAIDKVVRIGHGEYGHVYAHIQFNGDRLSITGVEGPLKSGNARGGCGQIVDATVSQYAPGWSAALHADFQAIWRKWHLNDMRAGCEHQRAEEWNKRPIYPDKPTDAYVKHPDGHDGWNMLVWLPVEKGGLLSAPCLVCGYKYGSKWLHEDVPADVLDFLAGLPATDIQPAWV